jgi:autotransporter-associated beta strand protein
MNLAVQLNSPTISTTNLAASTSPNTINVTAVPLLTGFPSQFPIIQYSAASGDLTTFMMGTLPPASPAYAAYVTNNMGNSSIDIVITAGPSVPTLTWDGRPNGNWDLSTTNWRPKVGPNTNFTSNAFVTFDDSLTGTATVNLTTTLIPANVTVSNSSASYVFTGSGGIGGNVTLVKTNTGTLVLDNNGNTSTGGVLINQGTVQVGNNDGQGALPPGNVDVEGTLTFARNDSITVSNVISGDGTLTQNSALQNTLTLTGDSTFSGTAIVSQGTLQIGSTNAIGNASGVTVSGGGTLDVNGFTLFGNGNTNLVVTVSGSGVGGNGAIVNGTTNGLTKVFHTVTLAADATFGGNGNWDIRNSIAKNSPADGQLNGAFNLTKVGTNTVTINNVIVDTGLKNINVQAGTLDFTSGTTSLGDPTYTATVSSNATLTLDTLGVTVSKNVVLNSGATLKGTSTNGLGGPVTLIGQVTLAGAATISTSSNSYLQLNSPIVGSGSLTKSAAGVVFLPAVNLYTGSTIISGGTLALTNNGGDGSIAASTNINVTAGGTLDVTGRSDDTLTLASGQTLSGGIGVGSGAINGILSAPTGSFIAPGDTTNNGTLTVSGSATLQGTTTMKLNPTNVVSDQLGANSLTYGGTLNVLALPGSFTNGQTFQLFVASNGVYNAANFGSVNLPSVPGFTWTNKLQVNGTISIGAVVPGRPGITHISLSGTNLTIQGTNGTAGFGYTVRGSTNVSLPVATWSAVASGTFSGGNFTNSFGITPGVPQSFYLISIP